MASAYNEIEKDILGASVKNSQVIFHNDHRKRK